MNKQFIRLAIALPTLLLTITPGLAQVSQKDQIQINPSNPNLSKPIAQPDTNVNTQPAFPIQNPQKQRPFCLLPKRWCHPEEPITQIKNPQDIPPGVEDSKTIPSSLPTKQLR